MKSQPLSARISLRFALPGLLALCTVVPSHAEVVPGASQDQRTQAGRALAYAQMDQASLESLTTPERLMRVAQGGFAPTEIWRALEHGEKLECLDCIPYVAALLFDANANTREISAWWLRRRIFGVFGPGQVYARTIDTLNDTTLPDKRRAYAAEALGEFLSAAGARHVARAAVEDASALVRASAVRALCRLNSPGPNGELAAALADPDEQVRLAALHASTRVNAFRELEQVVARIDDPSSAVRVAAIEALGALHARDAVVALVAKLSPTEEASASVRAAAAATLGELGDPAARGAVEAAYTNDSDHFVRDAAAIALRRL
jgi:HEAT repeat protein